MTLEQTTSDTNADVVKETEEPHILACPMTGLELDSEQENLLRLLQDMEELELQKKSVVADFASRKKKFDEMLEASRKKLRSKETMRSIMCTLQLNFTTLIARLIRQDNGDQVNERPMNEEERRMLNATPELPGMDEDAEALGPEPDTTPTEPPEGEPLTGDEATANATEKFGPDEDEKDISGAADLSDDEPEGDEEYNFGLEE